LVPITRRNGQRRDTGEEVEMKSGFHRILRSGTARAALVVVLGAPKKW
jgi:hypothetical protein